MLSVVSCDGDVAYWGIKPNIEDLVFISFLRYGSTPNEITSDASLLQSISHPCLCGLQLAQLSQMTLYFDNVQNKDEQLV